MTQISRSSASSSRPKTKNTLASHTPEYLMSACLAVERARIAFKEDLGFPHGKSRELMAKLILDRWLRRTRQVAGFPEDGAINPLPNPNGKDAVLPNGEYVEFKSADRSGDANVGFFFESDFDFDGHKMISMMELSCGIPRRMFIAYGQAVMHLLQKELHLAKLRPSYNDTGRASLNIHVQPKPAFTPPAGKPGTRYAGTNGLENLLGAAGASIEVVDIEGDVVGMRAPANEKWKDWITVQGPVLAQTRSRFTFPAGEFLYCLDGPEMGSILQELGIVTDDGRSTSSGPARAAPGR
jgi:hypothetical protein